MNTMNAEMLEKLKGKSWEYLDGFKAGLLAAQKVYSTLDMHNACAVCQNPTTSILCEKCAESERIAAEELV